MSDEPIAFATPAELRAWLERNHDSRDELRVLLHNKGSGRPSITWPELVDELLCFGWIDGHMKSLGNGSRTQRITPRRPGSTWSARNVARAEALIAEGRMTPAGLAAFEARREDRTAVYTYEQGGEPQLPPAFRKRFRAEKDAWAFFDRQAPGYKRHMVGWVMGAKREETRERRLGVLIEASAKHEPPPAYRLMKLRP